MEAVFVYCRFSLVVYKTSCLLWCVELIEYDLLLSVVAVVLCVCAGIVIMHLYVNTYCSVGV